MDKRVPEEVGEKPETIAEKPEIDDDVMTSDGRPAEELRRLQRRRRQWWSPTVTRRVGGTSSSRVEAERSRVGDSRKQQ